MGKYKKYEKYKYSGIEWIGELPEHWDVGGLTKYLESIVDYRGKTPTKVDDGIFLVTAKNIKTGKIDYLNSKEYVKEEEYEEIMRRGKPKKGDVLFTTEAPLGEVANVDREDIALAQRIIKFVGKKEAVDNYYLKYWIMSNSFQSNLQTFGTGSTATGIKASKLSKLILVLPYIREQAQIANFLDQKTSEIDLLIADKKKLIELLEEKRQTIITEAVTKGLNPDVKMKDSGIEWIGDIPDIWEVVRLKDVCCTNPNKSDLNINEDIEVTFIPMENIVSTGIVDTSITKNISDVYNGYTCFKDEDIIIAKVTPCFENGNIAIVKDLSNGIGFGTTELHVLRAEKNINNEFIYYLLQSNRFKFEGIASMYGVAGLKRIPTEFIKNFKFALPNREEQNKITEYINKKVNDIYFIVNEIKEQIQKLKEYRQSLISEAVTGKIDVRDYFNEV